MPQVINNRQHWQTLLEENNKHTHANDNAANNARRNTNNATNANRHSESAKLKPVLPSTTSTARNTMDPETTHMSNHAISPPPSASHESVSVAIDHINKSTNAINHSPSHHQHQPSLPNSAT
jgi:hypothetical protein